MASKVITRTCKSTQLTVYGINPADYSGVKSINYLYNGDFATATPKEIESIKKAVATNEFIPAQVVSTGNAIETKYALSFDDFVFLSHIYDEEKDKRLDGITRTITLYILLIYGVNTKNLDEAEKHDVCYYGDYTKISKTEKDKLIRQVVDENNGFYPAYIKIESRREEKRIISFADFIQHAHIATEDENED